MAWVPKTENEAVAVHKEESVTLPASATTEYGSEIDFLKPSHLLNRYVSLFIVASAVSGTNIDIGLYGAFESGGTKFLLLDSATAPVADLTTAAPSAAGVVDINAYPAPYYYIGWTSDADESANTISVYIMVPQVR